MMADKRLIDANKLFESLRETRNYGLKMGFSAECVADAMLDVLTDFTPAIDAVPVAHLADLLERWNWDCAMCPHLDCDKCALKSCIDELKEIIDNSTRKDGGSDGFD